MAKIDTFGSCFPKTEWLERFFHLGEDFFENSFLSSAQMRYFKRFLRDAGVLYGDGVTSFAEFVRDAGWNSAASLSLMLVNLANDNPQMRWYAYNILNESRGAVENMLIGEGASEREAGNVARAYGHLSKTPFGTTLHWANVVRDEISGEETFFADCARISGIPLLYSIYRCAEKTGLYDFRLSAFVDETIDFRGAETVSPCRLFRLDEEEAKSLLLGLTARHGDFVVASFTHDLGKISLFEDKSSDDVIELARETVISNDVCR